MTFRVFGASVTSLRGTSAAIGVAGVFLIWVALRRYGRGAALAGMAWASGSLWLIAVSRDGFRNIIVVPAAALALLALLRWSDRPSRGTAILAGGAMALGLWTYQPLKLLPVLAVLWILWIRRSDRTRYEELKPTLRWCVAAYLLVASPMIYTAITDFRNYFGRGAGVSVFNPGVGAEASYPIQVLRTLGMFVVTGDPNERHDVNALPLLGPVLFLPFALGIRRAWQHRHEHAHKLLLLGLVVFLIPPLVAPEGFAPHFLRSLGLAPFVAGAVGLGCVEAVSLAARWPRRRSIHITAVAVCAAALVALGFVSIRAYLDRPERDRYEAFSFALVSLAAAADRGPGTVAIVDDYGAFDVRFLDSTRLPAIEPPGRALHNPGVYSLIVAANRADIAAATNPATAARATIVARDPTGQPTVWEVVP